MLLLLPCLFSGGNFVGLVGRVWEELVSGGFCMLVGNLFFFRLRSAARQRRQVYEQIGTCT